MQYISYNTAGRDLPDIYALALGRCAPLGVVRIYLANPSLLCYNLYILPNPSMKVANLSAYIILSEF